MATIYTYLWGGLHDLVCLYYQESVKKHTYKGEYIQLSINIAIRNPCSTDVNGVAINWRRVVPISSDHTSVFMFKRDKLWRDDVSHKEFHIRVQLPSLFVLDTYREYIYKIWQQTVAFPLLSTHQDITPVTLNFLLQQSWV